MAAAKEKAANTAKKTASANTNKSKNPSAKIINTTRHKQILIIITMGYLPPLFFLFLSSSILLVSIFSFVTY